MSQREFNEKLNNRESFLLAADGCYLGRLTLSEYAPDSISNPYGTHGSVYSSASIWNQYGSYGSQYSSLSPFNPYTSTPPFVFLWGQKVGVLTKNSYLAGGIDPATLKDWMAKYNLYY